MGLLVGIVIFAFGILIAVCLHEAGHMVTAKRAGMKVTEFFVGFGPRVWSFTRGETEYGLKAIPLGGFCKIVGMTPQDDDVAPEDEHRAMWKFPVWKRTIVMAAGSVTHFILAFVALWVVLVFLGLPDISKVDGAPAKVGRVEPCVAEKFQIDPQTRTIVSCKPGTDPRSPAAQAGLQHGDVITAIGGRSTPTYGDMRAAVRSLRDVDTTITYQRDGQTHTAAVHVYAVERLKESAFNKTVSQLTPNDVERAGLLGVNGEIPVVRVGPAKGVVLTGRTMGAMVGLTFDSLKQIPEKIPKLVSAIGGAQRDPDTPVSVVGASRIGGELISMGAWTNVLYLFAVLNLFFGIFNLLPLLPMDGGHIAISWFEKVRSWIAVRRGRPDPGRVDYVKLTPVTLAVISVLGVFVLLTVTADIINPISIPR
jgi:membrane-associated protease RseP (regulator of RpoE activity)